VSGTEDTTKKEEIQRQEGCPVASNKPCVLNQCFAHHSCVVSGEKREEGSNEGFIPHCPKPAAVLCLFCSLTESFLPVPHCDDQATSVFSVPSRNQMLEKNGTSLFFLHPF